MIILSLNSIILNYQYPPNTLDHNTTTRKDDYNTTTHEDTSRILDEDDHNTTTHEDTSRTLDEDTSRTLDEDTHEDTSRILDDATPQTDDDFAQRASEDRNNDDIVVTPEKKDVFLVNKTVVIDAIRKYIIAKPLMLN